MHTTRGLALTHSRHRTGGSIGSELCRQLSRCRPRLLILVDHSEFNLYSIDTELLESPGASPIACHLLAEIEAAAVSRPGQLLMIGFNRRFAPQVVKMKALLDTVAEPKSFVMTVNAGAIPPDHWTQDKAVGGGRIIGEGCHSIDLLRHLAGAPIVRHHAVALGRHAALPVRDDKTSIVLEFADGSVGTVHYLANGDKGFPKERPEVFCAGRVLQLDNFRKLRGWGWKGFSAMNLWRQDKGQAACAKAFVEAVRDGGTAPIAADEILEVSRVTVEIAESIA